MMLTVDYKLRKLFSMSEEVLNNYVEAWLILAIVDFNSVRADNLIYDKDTQTFSTTLNSEDIKILARLMVRYWLEKEVNDVLAFENTLQDHDFKTYSQAQNLDSKRNLLNLQIEETDKVLSLYTYRNNNWSSWLNQSFVG
jgi:hypothetical protein